MNVSKGNWSTRARIVAEWFGVERPAAQTARFSVEVNPPPPAIELRGSKLVLLTGPSGAGKSTLLHRLRLKHNQQTSWRDLQRTRLSNSLVIDAMAEAMGDNAGDSTDEPAIIAALEALSRVGLGEVWTYLRTPAQLSDGQRWRLRLALALARARPSRQKSLYVLAADEFAAPLDRITALVVARALRKAVSARPDLCAVVATTRDDITAALDPDLLINCDFGTFHFRERGSL